MKHQITDFDIFYISYDEPQKEEFWARLSNLAPWARRVDGVKGFDAAHKRCAELSETDRFITVDGDNIVYPEFFQSTIDITPALVDCTLSWAGRNIINGLCYGNGGLKLWTREFVMNMRSHEAASEGGDTVDFCWDRKYVQLNAVFSDTCPNGSPFQAFRAGFREGIKMTLDKGERVQATKLSRAIHPKNFRRLLTWASVGADVENGDWAVYGTRCGIFAANLDGDFQLAQISDYDWFKSYFYNTVLSAMSASPDRRCARSGISWNGALLAAASTEKVQVLQQALGLKIADLDASQSAFFKAVSEPPRQSSNVLLTEIEADRA